MLQRLGAVETQLAARDSQVAALNQQLGALHTLLCPMLCLFWSCLPLFAPLPPHHLLPPCARPLTHHMISSSASIVLPWVLLLAPCVFFLLLHVMENTCLNVRRALKHLGIQWKENRMILRCDACLSCMVPPSAIGLAVVDTYTCILPVNLLWSAITQLPAGACVFSSLIRVAVLFKACRNLAHVTHSCCCRQAQPFGC